MADPALELLEIRVERVLAVREGAAQAVVLEREGKRFFIFVGPTEGAAVRRELIGERAERPLTHDILDYVLKGFEITVVKVVISALVNEVFCATITLSQAGSDGAQRDVRLDARASDSIVIALKAGVPLFVTRRVFDHVKDMTEQLAKLDEAAAEGMGVEEEDSEEESTTSGLEAEEEDLEDAAAGDEDSDPDLGLPEDGEDDEDRDRPLSE